MKSLAALSGLITLAAALALPALAQDAGSLSALHSSINHLLTDEDAYPPFYLDAEAHDRIERGTAAFYVPKPFDRLSAALSRIAAWCDILPLHLNVKGCLYDATAQPQVLTLFLGHKEYQEPDDAHRVDYQFMSEVRDGYLGVRLFAEEGPMGMSDLDVEFDAMPVGDETFARLRTSEQQSWLSSKAVHVYLATKGSDKRGISVVGNDESGRPIYVDGEKAAIERNVLRYFFALTAFLDAAETAGGETFERALEKWFDATERYPQLHELERQEYLAAKRRERANQLALQSPQPDRDR